MSRDTRSSAFARIAFGETGFERAAVWSAVGFAGSYVAVDAAALLGVASATPSITAPIVAALAVVAAVGVVAFAAVGGGALPSILLAYGPFAALLLRTTGPDPYTIPSADPLGFAAALVEPLGVALAGGVAVGLAGYVIGRVAAGLGTDDDIQDEEAEQDDNGERDDSGERNDSDERNSNNKE
ncbi:hypothetical protein [Halorubrum sp. DTA46]|uniref:hypothetical protein n=1 Tax=Halorubrum sp. DTA46 TaxID=3402162 RepID=UPI003AAA60EA